MHYHAEVWVPEKENYKQQVDKTLANFSEDNGGFYDWYVIGGRWSGEHTLWSLKKKFGARKINKINDEFDSKFGWWTNKDNSNELRAKQYEEVFRKHISKEQYDGPMIAWRDNYKEDGYKDDIIALVDIPWEYFSCYTLVLSERGKGFENRTQYFQSEVWNGSTFQKAEYDPRKILETKDIFTGFLVTVDYHC